MTEENGNRMDCERFREFVHELDRPGTKGAELREAALTHAESCGQCGVLLTETESLDFALSKIAHDAEKIVAASKMETVVLGAFRREHGKASRWQMQRATALIGLAAALLLALGLSWQHRPNYLRSSEAELQADIKAPTRVIESSTVQNHGDIQPNVQAEPKPASTSAAVSNDSAGEEEFAQGFSLLPYADDPSMMEGSSVVRVILSRSALASLGAPLSVAETTEQVPADLVVSPDGTPEAIRLVAQN